MKIRLIANSQLKKTEMNNFGHNFRLAVWGESHGEAVGVTIDGVKAGIALSQGDFEADMARRRSGAVGTTARRESDTVHILSGLYDGCTTGAPLTLMLRNVDVRSGDYAPFCDHFRPSHADRVADVRFGGWNDARGGGHFSGRMTAVLVAAGVVAKRQLGTGVGFDTRIVELGGESDSAKFEARLQEAAAAGDSLGAVVECRIRGMEAGLGDPLFDGVESLAAHLIFSIPAVKGVEFGAGFEAARRRGSENNDLIVDADGRTATNNDGGINGGIANGNDIVVRVAFKPTPSIARAQMTYNRATESVEPLEIHGRHDVCVALRGAVVVEAAMAVVLTDLALRPKPFETRKR